MNSLRRFSGLPIAVTCGDPAGVGPEIVVSWLKRAPHWAGRICPIGPSEWLEQLGQDGVAVPVTQPVLTPGKPSPAGARCAWDAMLEAAAGCREGRYAAVVTGPVSKAALQQIGYPFPGQTEFFANAWGGMPSMAFDGGGLRVVLATWHQPLQAVIHCLISDPSALVHAIERAHDWAVREGCPQPRIAVCGLNPHAGEGGILGREEVDIFNPLIASLRARFPGVSNCLPADTVFHRQRLGEFDAVVALYHDQALVAIKTIAFFEAVNLTLGLPFLRTSPDHGTAFSIAGLGQADTRSFARAVEIAAKMVP